mgnify:FL=1
MIEQILPVVIGVLAASGMLVSIYMSLAALGIADPESTRLPAFCRLREGTCRTVLDAPQGRLAGIPNPVWGIGFYAIALANACARIWLGRYYAALPMLALVLGVLGFTVYLLYVLLRVIRVPCFPCFTAHAINFGIAAAYTASLLLES